LQVLCGQPEPANLFGFCADYLEGRLEERDHPDQGPILQNFISAKKFK
jgi:hypothetical protein